MAAPLGAACSLPLPKAFNQGSPHQRQIDRELAVRQQRRGRAAGQIHGHRLAGHYSRQQRVEFALNTFVI